MQRIWRILVLTIVFAALLAPATALCLSHSASAHSCCMPEIQMSAQDCCSHAAPQTPAPVRPATSLISEAVLSFATYDAPSIQKHVPALHPRTMAIPVQPPATILRT